MRKSLTIFESILDDFEAGDMTTSAAEEIAATENRPYYYQMPYQKWYDEVSNGDYEQMFCISRHFLGPDYVNDIEDFREDLVHIIERFFGDHYSMQIVATNQKYEDLGIQYEPNKREGGPLLNETENRVRYKFAVEFQQIGCRKVFTFLDFAASVYRLIRRPTSAKTILSRNNNIDNGRLEVYAYVNEEYRYLWPGGDNTDCIVTSSAYEYRYKNNIGTSCERDVVDFSNQMYAIDLCREQDDPFGLGQPYDYEDYRECCRQWLKKRARRYN